MVYLHRRIALPNSDNTGSPCCSGQADYQRADHGEMRSADPTGIQTETGIPPQPCLQIQEALEALPG